MQSAEDQKISPPQRYRKQNKIRELRNIIPLKSAVIKIMEQQCADGNSNKRERLNRGHNEERGLSRSESRVDK